MLTQKKRIGNRLRQVLINDKRMDPKRLEEVIKNDLFELLYQYMDINQGNVRTKIDIENGEYILRCKVCARRIKMMGFVPREDV